MTNEICPRCSGQTGPEIGYRCWLCQGTGYVDDGEAAIEREREAKRQEFAEKLRAWRETGGIPGYTGPRAGRDG